MTRNVLAFGGPERVAWKMTDLNEIVRSAPGLFSSLPCDGITLRTACTEKSLPVMIDMARFEWVILDLIQNAAYTMPDGGVLSITAESLEFGAGFDLGEGKEGSAVCALLRASTTGMAHPFFTDEEGDGPSLFLPVVYRIVKEHHGSICVRSKAGKDQEVNIYLPLAERGDGQACSPAAAC